MHSIKSKTEGAQRTDWKRATWTEQLKKITTDAKKNTKQYLHDSEVPGGGE